LDQEKKLVLKEKSMDEKKEPENASQSEDTQKQELTNMTRFTKWPFKSKDLYSIGRAA
jgi:hypothetical protein